MSLNESKKPKESIVRKLFARSMNRCAFPNCTTSIVVRETNATVGKVCHISARSVGGPRYRSELSDDERNGDENLILLCGVHHDQIDDPMSAALFSIDTLKKMKEDHERASENAVEQPAISDAVVRALLETISSVTPTVTYDLRHAKLSAGGQGGHMGGGGGAGGVIVIGGVTPRGFHEPIDLDGGPGQAPGGGGGGGGSVQYVGRPATESDLENGLEISSIFFANAVEVKGLWSVLSGGWTWFEVPRFPSPVHLNVVCVVETGKIPMETLLRLDFEVKDEGQATVVAHFVDLAVSTIEGKVRRYVVTCQLQFDASSAGVYAVELSSGEQFLAKHSIEVKLKNGGCK